MDLIVGLYEINILLKLQIATFYYLGVTKIQR